MRTAGCTLLDHKGNEDSLEELKIQSIIRFAQNYGISLKQHVRRMENSRNKLANVCVA
jgi:hypothetical protein